MRRVHLNNSSSPPKKKKRTTEAELEREERKGENRRSFLCVVIPARSRMAIKQRERDFRLSSKWLSRPVFSNYPTFGQDSGPLCHPGQQPSSGK